MKHVFILNPHLKCIALPLPIAEIDPFVLETCINHIFTREPIANSLKSQPGPGLPCYAEVLAALIVQKTNRHFHFPEKNC